MEMFRKDVGDGKTLGPSAAEGPSALTQAHPLAAFFVLTFLISWTYELVAFGLLELEFAPWSVPAVFGPALAALIVTGTLDGSPGVRALLRRLILWRVGVRWYLFALVAIPAPAIAGHILFPGGGDNLDDPAYLAALTYAALLLIMFFVGGGQEELGWRGFALPRMQERSGPLQASVLLGVIWGVWHLPLFVLVPVYDDVGFGYLSVAAMFIVSLAVVLTWLFNHAQGSVLLVMMAHASVNASLGFAPITRLAAVVACISMVLGAVMIAVATRGQLGYRPRPTGGAEITASSAYRPRGLQAPPGRFRSS